MKIFLFLIVVITTISFGDKVNSVGLLYKITSLYEKNEFDSTNIL